MATRIMTDYIKSLGTITSLSGQTLLCADSAGKMAKAPRKAVVENLMTGADTSSKDLDQITIPGIYKLSGDEINQPFPNTGILEVFTRVSDVIQRATSLIGVMKIRYSRSGNWSDWVTV